MAWNNLLGKWGETVARELLIAAGYAIIECNWRSGHYELDIIAQNGNRIVFVEVKSRSDINDDPREAMTRDKQLRTIRAANTYMKAFNITLEPQFDFIGIAGTEDNYRIEHVQDAFFPSVRTYK